MTELEKLLLRRWRQALGRLYRRDDEASKGGTPQIVVARDISR